jgi:hypothetical protein
MNFSNDCFLFSQLKANVMICMKSYVQFRQKAFFDSSRLFIQLELVDSCTTSLFLHMKEFLMISLLSITWQYGRLLN